MGLRCSSYIEAYQSNSKEVYYISNDWAGCPRSRISFANDGSSTFSTRYSEHCTSSTSSSVIAYSDSSTCLDQDSVTFGCCNCRTHLSSVDQIMSRDYRGRTGDAFLMNNVVNVIEGDLEERSMITGNYLVCDILCHWCRNPIGWKYVRSQRKDQKFKEGKYILELKMITKCT